MTSSERYQQKLLTPNLDNKVHFGRLNRRGLASLASRQLNSFFSESKPSFLVGLCVAAKFKKIIFIPFRAQNKSKSKQSEFKFDSPSTSVSFPGIRLPSGQKCRLC